MYGKKVSVKAELKDMLAMYCSDSEFENEA